ncbi:MAG: GNAT family N-acetyltransferase [Acidobacteria bacterium]|nr:GNAT family N-acetyltransferase [Nitrospiraceae bacterium]MCI0625131.1 GNAT family N-acetyltransferase [Acidobacteriota bacterium]MCI0717858.1 GNAT family N-acetyltransferase [Acidobacteriota bacterium]
MKVSIRRMEFEDVPKVVAIEERWSYLSKWGEPGYRAVMSDSRVYTCLVAEDGEHRAQPPVIAGFAVVAKLIDDCELCNLVVLPECLSKGVGYELLQACFEVAQYLKIARMLLEVRQSNQRAIDFYARNGFRIINERRNYYLSPRESAWVMERAVELG